MFGIAASLAGLMMSASADVPVSVDRRTFSSIIYDDHYESHAGVNLASHNLAYTSSIEVTLAQYGGHAKRCAYSFSAFTLRRRFAFDILHQAKPYGVDHRQAGTRSWTRVPPAAAGEVKGSCAATLNRIIAPAAASANSLQSWKDVVLQDDGVVRKFLASRTRRRPA